MVIGGRSSHLKSIHKVSFGGVCLFPTCKLLWLKLDASSIMTIENKHQNHSIHIPGNKENTRRRSGGNLQGADGFCVH